jgi:hypothetical protein
VSRCGTPQKGGNGLVDKHYLNCFVKERYLSPYSDFHKIKKRAKWLTRIGKIEDCTNRDRLYEPSLQYFPEIGVGDSNKNSKKVAPVKIKKYKVKTCSKQVNECFKNLSIRKYMEPDLSHRKYLVPYNSHH